MTTVTNLSVTTDTGLLLRQWESIDVDADLFVPAGMLAVEGPWSQDGAPIPWALLLKSNAISAALDARPVFSGNRTACSNDCTRTSDRVSIEAADRAKVLIDCQSPKPFKRPAGSLASFAAELCGAFGVPVSVGAGASIPRRLATQLGATEPVWSLLESCAQELDLTIWTGPDGVLRIEALTAYYAAPPVAALICGPAGPGASGNNIERYVLRDDVGERYSHVVVRGNGSQRAAQANKATGLLQAPVLGEAVDPDLAARGVYRPLVLDRSDVRNIEQAQRRARRELLLRRLRGTRIELTVAGLTTASGLPWQLCQMVSVAIPDKGINGPYLVAGRRYMADRKNGARTDLLLIEPGVL